MGTQMAPKRFAPQYSKQHPLVKVIMHPLVLSIVSNQSEWSVEVTLQTYTLSKCRGIPVTLTKAENLMRPNESPGLALVTLGSCFSVCCKNSCLFKFSIFVLFAQVAARTTWSMGVVTFARFERARWEL